LIFCKIFLQETYITNKNTLKHDISIQMKMIIHYQKIIKYQWQYQQKKCSLSKLTVLPTNFFFGIYTNNPSAKTLLTDLQTETVRR
jgi:hypothetical protein